MKLLHATLRPGRVIEVLDSGKIKVEAPGLFSKEDQESLPPVYPFFGLHANTYSEPLVGDEVWVLNLEDNPLQLHWFRKDDRSEHNSEIEGEENVEVVCNREAGIGYATIYFSDGTGWMFRNGKSFINIKKDGTILLDPNIPNRKVHLCQDSISLGKEGGSKHPAACGDEVLKSLNQIQACLEAMRSAAESSFITKPIAVAIGSTPEVLKSQNPKVVSINVTLE